MNAPSSFLGRWWNTLLIRLRLRKPPPPPVGRIENVDDNSIYPLW